MSILPLCCRSLSLVPPAYYARLAAERGAMLMRTASGEDGGGALLLPEVPVSCRLGSSMHYV